MAKRPINLMWIRRDLRLKDNHALAEALKANAPVQLLFIFDPEILEKLEDRDDARVEFIHNTLMEIKDELRSRGGDLWIFHGKPLQIFERLFEEHQVAGLYLNHDYEPQAIRRDREVEMLCQKKAIHFQSFKDQVIFEKSEIQTDKGTPYSVFGAYKRKWLAALAPEHLKAHSSDGLALDQNIRLQAQPQPAVTLKNLGFEKSQQPIPARRIRKKTLESYDKQRDFPAIEGTSHLGLHLRFGTLSPRLLVKAAKELNAVFLSELIWREFFMQILFHFPHTVDRAFRPEFDNMPWRDADSDFKRWCEGQTGVPIVDAGMRELNATGFMHNRVRMITASYLTKHLLIDWRRGERYFARKLLDFDLAANVGNWQWVAGSGCDAAPYFRIFNPEIQTKRFDPQKEYIRRWVPEFETPAYPSAIVAHAEGRDRAMRAYFRIMGKTPIKNA